jgi:hypothetical protein
MAAAALVDLELVHLLALARLLQLLSEQAAQAVRLEQ